MNKKKIKPMIAWAVIWDDFNYPTGFCCNYGDCEAMTIYELREQAVRNLRKNKDLGLKLIKVKITPIK